MKHLMAIMAVSALAFCLTAAGEETRLEDLDHLDLVTVGYGKPTKDKSVYGQPLQIAGVKYKHGLGVHAVSFARLELDGKSESFHAMVGVNDYAKQGSVEFIVWGDGQAAFPKRRHEKRP